MKTLTHVSKLKVDGIGLSCVPWWRWYSFSLYTFGKVRVDNSYPCVTMGEKGDPSCPLILLQDQGKLSSLANLWPTSSCPGKDNIWLGIKCQPLHHEDEDASSREQDLVMFCLFRIMELILTRAKQLSKFELWYPWLLSREWWLWVFLDTNQFFLISTLYYFIPVAAPARINI